MLPGQIITITAIPTVVKVVLNNSAANSAMQPPSMAIATVSHHCAGAQPSGPYYKW